MLKNYLKIAFRNLIKNKLDSAISIGGLAVGLACCILLIFYVRFEWSHDNFHKNANRVYRVTYQSDNTNSGEVFKSLSTPYPLGVALDSTFPEVEQVINIARGQIPVERNGKFTPRIVTFADPGFFQAFTFPLLYGTAETALANAGNVVLTEEAAEYYFGEKQVIGETITVRLHKDLYTLTISAVAQSVPANSSIQFDLVLPFENYPKSPI